MQPPLAAVGLGLALAACAVPGAWGAASGVESIARRQLRRESGERVEAIAESFHLQEFIAALPRNASKDQEAHIVKSLEEQVQHLKQTASTIAQAEHREGSPEERARLVAARSSMKVGDQKMLEKMDAWSQRMNRKTRLGAMDVVSKLENAIHFVKKGALSGNEEAAKRLDSVLAKMGGMVGGGASTGNFLH
mmetsp:Transcript_135070/g.419737  ORF Transcript_135070/g.419737 Transcript_135070/m.419737 type:complete len:192 (-) Transcript_135070:28-603(-)|eukprot:CAMPEP_0204594082 /NCGR_PEP_ID=MMETSP0661-20131031/51876_1 /ASSEMBLY_ACC=CAM_ASM_000606 /TAXON_ID=109239 /ORGANISM="Alexandrium margalefi, Strain AMGDE01CS-322" /LENGTH=191 /DNA_ID=CAMNT_0051604447 /DNA_START=51 /DNA_END=626 /DNA_ORIENTATION=-